MSMPVIPIPEGMETKIFLLSEDALNYLPEMLQETFPGKRPWLVADENTWKAAGARAEKLLKDAGADIAGKHIFPGTPRLHPAESTSQMLAKLMPENIVPVAIGSGVINDITKCASGIAGVKYCCVPTACSVDGYTSFGAAMTRDGFKMTIQCPAPYAICADSSVLKTAPWDMFASGYADLLTKVPAGTDWVIADELGEHPIRKDVWELIQGHIRDWTSDPGNLLKVFEGLAATGYSMQIMRDSRPASGAEHLFSHIWEMEGLQYQGEDVSHGFKVGIGLLASTLLQTFVLKHSFEELKPLMKLGLTVAEREAEIDELLKLGCYGDKPKATAMQKFTPAGEALNKRRVFIGEHWTALQNAICKQMLPYETVREMLLKAKCPVTPDQIGLSREQFLHSIRTSQLIRIRYTICDLLYELGLLDVAMNDLEIMLK